MFCVVPFLFAFKESFPLTCVSSMLSANVHTAFKWTKKKNPAYWNTNEHSLHNHFLALLLSIKRIFTLPRWVCTRFGPLKKGIFLQWIYTLCRPFLRFPYSCGFQKVPYTSPYVVLDENIRSREVPLLEF